MSAGGAAGVGSSGLSGPDYACANRTAATRDDDVAGRWVAVDESGWDGEQLYGRADRYLSIGSVAVDDESAARIVDRLRHDTALTQPLELKFAQFAGSKRSNRLEALAALLAPQGPLDRRAHVYLVDKHYFVTGKIIDLLLEEHAFARGVNLYEGGLARTLAWTLFNEGPRALGPKDFDRLIATMVGFASMRNREGSVISVDVLFAEIDRAWARSHRRRVTEILSALRHTRAEAEYYLKVLKEPAYSLPAMEPLIPCLPEVAHLWSREIGGLSVLVDEHRVLTDTVLDFIGKVAASDIQLAGPFKGIRKRAWAKAVRTVVRGVSRDHPSIQLADLIAGAGQVVARRHAGVPSTAGERLYPLVVPLISAESIVPHDDPARFAAIDR